MNLKPFKKSIKIANIKKSCFLLLLSIFSLFSVGFSSRVFVNEKNNVNLSIETSVGDVIDFSNVFTNLSLSNITCCSEGLINNSKLGNTATLDVQFTINLTEARGYITSLNNHVLSFSALLEQTTNESIPFINSDTSISRNQCINKYESGSLQSGNLSVSNTSVTQNLLSFDVQIDNIEDSISNILCLFSFDIDISSLINTSFEEDVYNKVDNLLFKFNISEVNL